MKVFGNARHTRRKKKEKKRLLQWRVAARATCTSTLRSTRQGGIETRSNRKDDYAKPVVFRRAKSEVADKLIRACLGPVVLKDLYS